MKVRVASRSVHAILISLVGGIVAGCASVAPAPIDPIEAQTEELFEQVQYELQLQDIVLLNPYLETDSPRVDEFEAIRAELIEAAEILIDYSVEVIELARIGQDAEAVTGYVSQLRKFHASLTGIPQLRSYFASVDIDAIASEAAGQPDLTRALGVATPIHELAVDAVRALIRETGNRFDLAYDETYDKIVGEFSAFTAYTDKLVIRRNDVLEQLLLLDAAREGDAEAWRALLAGDERLRARLGAEAASNIDNTDEAEALLVARLGRLMETWGYLEPSWTNYQATLKELYAVDANARNLLRLASFVIESWDRAQRQLATGQKTGFVVVTKELAYLALRRAAR